MIPIAWDTETALIRPAQLAPKMACLTWQTPGTSAGIEHAATAKSRIADWLLRTPQGVLIGANVAYDFAVVCEQYPELRKAVFDAYDADRVTDVQIRQKLLDIAGGVYRGRIGAKGLWIVHKYSLEDLAKRCAGLVLEKDAWRLSYGEFLDVPLSGWVEHARSVVQPRAALRLRDLERSVVSGEADADEVKAELEGLRSMVAADPTRCVDYPLDDARATLAVYQAQERHSAYLKDQFRQTRAAFWLHLSSAWGLHTDAAGVEILKRETESALEEVCDELVQLGLVRENGQRDTKAAKRRMIDVCKEEGLTLRRTEGHGGEGKCKRLDGTPVADGTDECEEHVTLDAEACAATEDEVLVNYAEFSTLKKVLSNDVVALSGGIFWPVHTRYDLAETGRTTSSKPNIQNLCKRPGIREAFVPREGNVFFCADYPQLELYTLAQCCMRWVGFSKLAEALIGGLDPHTALAATILKTTYEDAAKRIEAGDVEADDARSLAKKANFGLPGGMGIPKFEKILRKELKPEAIIRLGINVERLKQLKEQWFHTWPELPHYFARVAGLTNNASGKAFVETLFTQRWRGGASYCATANNGFQALGVDCAKEAGWRICKAQYVDVGSAMFNTRTVAFVHDEFVGECKDDYRAHDVAFELARHMSEGANVYLPDVPIPAAKIKPHLMRRWSKKAKAVFDQNNRLVPWG